MSETLERKAVSAPVKQDQSVAARRDQEPAVSDGILNVIARAAADTGSRSMTPTSDAAEPDYLATRLTWTQQVELHMRAHNSAPLTLCQKGRLRIARDNGLTPWEAFEQIVGADNVWF